MKKNTYLLSFVGFIILVLIGCAKDDSSSSTAASSSTSSSSDTEVSAASGSGAISLSSKISMVTANTSDSTARTAFSHFTTDNFSSTADYNTDSSETYVYERSADAFNTANSILCMMAQTRADLMLNAGNYKAQIDEAKCDDFSGDSKSNTPRYNTWTVNSSRSDGEPMVVKAWVPWDMDENGEPDALIYAKMSAKRPPSSDHPWGFFTMNFVLKQGFTTSGTEVFKGYLKTRLRDGASILQFYNPSPDSSGNTYQYSVTLKRETDGTGKGITTMPVWDQSGPTSTQKTYSVAFNDNYFYKQKTTVSGGTSTAADPVCLDRNKYLKTAWRYGLYYDNGSRVNINSGFPIKASVSGTDYYGYIGYYGLWMPSDANVGDNSTVAKLDFSGSADQAGDNYTVRSWGGKLSKWTKSATTLGSIKNIAFEWADPEDSYNDYKIYWNGTNLIRTAKYNRSTQQWEDMTEATLTLTANNAPREFRFYSQALGGKGALKLTYGSYPNHTTPVAPTDNTVVNFSTREAVFPGDSVPSTLACYRNCPDPANIATGGYYTGALFNFSGSDNITKPNPYLYTFDNTTSGMVLQYNGAYDNGTQDNGTKTNVLLSSANSSGEFPYGIQSGVLFDNATFDNDTSERQAAMAALACLPSVYPAELNCPWEDRNAFSTYYTWETGHQEWNKLTVLVDTSDNSSVKFDPPMSVKYTHSGTTSNTGKSYDNVSFYLDYGGFGDLWGIPSFCVDKKTGEKTSCAADQSTRWVQEFVIPATSIVTQTKDGSTHYMVKPLQIEQSMKKTSSASVCTAAGVSLGELSLPDDSRYTAPDVGTRPTVEGPPAVVAGAKM